MDARAGATRTTRSPSGQKGSASRAPRSDDEADPARACLPAATSRAPDQAAVQSVSKADLGNVHVGASLGRRKRGGGCENARSDGGRLGKGRAERPFATLRRPCRARVGATISRKEAGRPPVAPSRPRGAPTSRSVAPLRRTSSGRAWPSRAGREARSRGGRGGSRSAGGAIPRESTPRAGAWGARKARKAREGSESWMARPRGRDQRPRRLPPSPSAGREVTLPRAPCAQGAPARSRVARRADQSRAGRGDAGVDRAAAASCSRPRCVRGLSRPCVSPRVAPRDRATPGETPPRLGPARPRPGPTKPSGRGRGLAAERRDDLAGLRGGRVELRPAPLLGTRVDPRADARRGESPAPARARPGAVPARHAHAL